MRDLIRCLIALGWSIIMVIVLPIGAIIIMLKLLF